MCFGCFGSNLWHNLIGKVMSGSVNKVILVGNLGRDPEIRNLNDGSRVANLSVATSEMWRDKTTGERKDRTEWHRVVIFNDKLVEVIEKYTRKGSKLYLEGQLQTRKWTDQSGQEKYSTEVVLQRYRGELTLLDGRGGQDSSQDGMGSSGDSFGAGDVTPPLGQGTRSGGAAPYGGGKSFEPSAVDDDEVPF